jgi:hypothetical protein
VHAKKLKKVNPVLDSAKMDAKCSLQTMCAGRAEKAGTIYLIEQPNKTNTNQGTILSL